MNILYQVTLIDNIKVSYVANKDSSVPIDVTVDNLE